MCTNHRLPHTAYPAAHLWTMQHTSSLEIQKLRRKLQDKWIDLRDSHLHRQWDRRCSGLPTSRTANQLQCHCALLPHSCHLPRLAAANKCEIPIPASQAPRQCTVLPGTRQRYSVAPRLAADIPHQAPRVGPWRLLAGWLAGWLAGGRRNVRLAGWLADCLCDAGCDGVLRCYM